ncbi:MAG: pyridoxamine 5'-phosphate oxidase family protein, partial [Pseudomonadota bacterium]
NPSEMDENPSQRRFGLPAAYATLETTLPHIWAILSRGVKDRRHGFHTPAIATVTDHGPSIRTVVMRDCREALRRLTFHTDLRTDKVKELEARPEIAWMLYDPASKTQLRLTGIGSVHHSDARAEEGWAKTRDFSRRCYCMPVAPGTAIGEPVGGLPEGMENRAPTEAESNDLGWPNFALVDTVVTRIEWLWLGHAGHRRAAFAWNGESWDGEWLIP